MSRFISRSGEMNGVYLNISNEKRGNTIRVTARCTVCGRERTRSDKSWRRADLSRCNCAMFDKHEWHSVVRVSKERCEEVGMRKSFHDMIHKQLKVYPDMKYDDFDTVIAHIGKRPAETEVYEYILGIRRGIGTHDRLAKDYYWKKCVKKKCSHIAEYITGKNHREAKRLVKKCDAETISGIETALDAMRTHKRSLVEDYNAFIGRKRRGMKVIDLFKTSKPNGAMYYCFTLECVHCGLRRAARARRFLHGEIGCLNGCERRVDGMVKNSSAAGNSPIYRSKQKQHVRKHGLSIDDVLMLSSHLSEYTMTAGSEAAIYANAELGVGAMNLAAWQADLSQDAIWMTEAPLSMYPTAAFDGSWL